MGDEAMEERTKRIVQTAIDLAGQGGWEAVRMRDIASHAKVALGTLYNRFSSKEEMLVAALEYEMSPLEDEDVTLPIAGDTELERVTAFFQMVTALLLAKPKLAHAVLRALSSGVPDLAEKVARFHDRVASLIRKALRGTGEARLSERREQSLAYLLQDIWFANLVGWMSGLHEQDAVVDRVREGARWLLAGMQEEG